MTDRRETMKLYTLSNRRTPFWDRFCMNYQKNSPHAHFQTVTLSYTFDLFLIKISALAFFSYKCIRICIHVLAKEKTCWVIPVSTRIKRFIFFGLNEWHDLPSLNRFLIRWIHSTYRWNHHFIWVLSSITVHIIKKQFET